MAFRDRSQGFGFVYVDIKQLLEQTDAINANPEAHPQEKTALSIHIPKKAAPAPVVMPAPAPAANEIKPEELASNVTNLNKQPMDARIKQIKDNLDRLQSLHHKLHAVLDELSTASRKKKTTEE